MAPRAVRIELHESTNRPDPPPARPADRGDLPDSAVAGSRPGADIPRRPGRVPALRRPGDRVRDGGRGAHLRPPGEASAARPRLGGPSMSVQEEGTSHGSRLGDGVPSTSLRKDPDRNDPPQGAPRVYRYY